MNHTPTAHSPAPLTSLSPLQPLFFYGQNLPPPTSHFRFTHQITKFPLSTGALATGGSSAAYCSRARKPDPNTHLEDPNLNVESLGENGSGLRRRLPKERVVLFKGPSEDGKGRVYMVLEKHLSQEFCREGERAVCINPVSPNVMEWRDCPLSTPFEFLKRNPELVNKLVLRPADMYHIAMEEIRKHGRMVMPLSKQVVDKPKIHLGRGIHVAYEEAMQYVVQFMKRHFPLTVAVCGKSSLETKIAFLELSVACESTGAMIGPWKPRAVPASKLSQQWRLGLAQLLGWIQYGIDFRRKK